MGDEASSAKRDRWADSSGSSEDEAKPAATAKRTAKRAEKDERPNDEAARVDDSAVEARLPAAIPAAPPSPARESSPAPAPARRRVRQPLLDGCRSVDAFERLDKIEEGSYGIVYRARDVASREIVALKRVKLTREACVDGFPITALRETNVLLALQHENIVAVKEMVVGREHDKVFMVMEYFDHDLKQCVERHDGPFSQAEVKCLAAQLLAGIEHMHSKWFIHRDIKTSNLLYSNTGKLSICDFGLARRYGDPVLPYTRNVVTLWYRCPELLLGCTEYSTAVDMSVGCVFAELLLKKPIFPGKTELEQLSSIFKQLGAPTEDRWPGFPKIGFGTMATTPLTDEGHALLDGLLALDPDARLDAHAAATHPYFQESPPPTPRHQMPTFQLQRV